MPVNRSGTMRILQAVDRQVDLPLQKRKIQFLDKDSFASQVIKGKILAPVSGSLHGPDL